MSSWKITGSVWKALFVVGLLACLPRLFAQASGKHRPPSVPLFVNDPFFSVWSMGNELTGYVTKHWTEAPQPIVGLIQIDGHIYRWMGTVPQHSSLAAPQAMEQIPVDVTSLHSLYRFAANGIELRVSFFTPLFPDDLDVLCAYQLGISPPGCCSGADAKTELSADALGQVLSQGHLDDSDQIVMPRPAASSAGGVAHLALDSLGSVGAQPVTRHISASFTETYAIEYRFADKTPKTISNRSM